MCGSLEEAVGKGANAAPFFANRFEMEEVPDRRDSRLLAVLHYRDWIRLPLAVRRVLQIVIALTFGDRENYRGHRATPLDRNCVSVFGWD